MLSALDLAELPLQILGVQKVFSGNKDQTRLSFRLALEPVDWCPYLPRIKLSRSWRVCTILDFPACDNPHSVRSNTSAIDFQVLLVASVFQGVGPRRSVGSKYVEA
jgi:hypothetical protein